MEGDVLTPKAKFAYHPDAHEASRGVYPPITIRRGNRNAIMPQSYEAGLKIDDAVKAQVILKEQTLQAESLNQEQPLWAYLDELTHA